MKKHRIGTMILGMLAAAVTVPAMQASAAAGVAPAPSAASIAAEDELILNDGRIIKGELIEEGDTEITFRVMVGSISAVRTYQRSDVLAIKRGTENEAGAETESAAPQGSAAADDGEGPSVYVLELKGRWGWDISEPSIRRQLKDAQQHEPDIVVLVIDAVFSDQLGNDLPDDVPQPFNIFGVEDIEPIFTQEVPTDWGYEPRWVVWIKSAMGGIAMLPMNFEEIYFHPDGRIGGLGYLIFNWGTTGSEVTREKLISANLGHAEGMAIRGGYDPLIVRAMSDMRTELSYKLEDGQAKLLRRLPDGPDEYLLTDNGTNEDFADTMQQRVRGEGNDALTLKADIAQTLGVSKGTVSTLDDLMWELGLSRDAEMIDDRSERILDRWADELTRARRRYPTLLEEYGRIQVQGDYNERRRARSQQIAKLEEMIRHIRRYWGIMYPQQFGMPTEPALQIQIEQIRQEQIKDRR